MTSDLDPMTSGPGTSMRSGERRHCGCEECSGRDGWAAPLAAEAAGAALLVLLTCTPLCAAADLHPLSQPSPLQAALAGGLVIAILVQCFNHISGALLNPAMCLARCVAGHMCVARACAAAAAQLLGSLLGGAMLAPLVDLRACRTSPDPHLPLITAACVEAMLTVMLALANCASWDRRNARLADSWPIRIGLCVVGLSLVGGELTGCSMNPARSLAPALYSGHWAAHWVYWVGPLAGGGAGATLYRAVWSTRASFLPPAPRSPRSPRSSPAPRIKHAHSSV